jgi:LacI family repressor for deo operon, udp, cdd, tsx, nupC, and nupG
VTIRLDDIARQAGVSTATVSRVLNNRGGVSEQARRSVLTAVDVLGYHRPVSLRGRATGLIAVLVPELRNPVFAEFAEAIEVALAHHRYNHLLSTRSPGLPSERAYIDMLNDHGVAGIIFISGVHSDVTAEIDQYQELIATGMPLAFINGYADDLDAIFVSTDDATAMNLAVRHLADLGHIKVGLAIGPERYVPSMRKIEGFRLALERHLPGQPVVAHIGSYTIESGQSAAADLIGQGVSAIVCASDFIAIGAVRGARALGLCVPEDISIVGYDGSSLVAYIDPPLTTVRQPIRTIAQTTVEALIDEISGRRVSRSEISIQPELVVRDSTGRHRPAAG